SGTASWLTLAVFEILGIDYSASGLTISPMLMPGMTNANYKLRFENTELSVTINKPEGFFRAYENTKYELDGKPVQNLENLTFTGGNHEIKVTFSGDI
ncbi:MAG: hypothetical protein KBS59_08065, partial [Clostridiales bacterium]|nr:hypothetical protein [Clostridiales bacterium]